MLFANEDPLQPINFADNVDIQGSDEPIIRNLDIILSDKIGLPSFASLFLGIMTFTEDSSGTMVVDFILHGRRAQSSLNAKFGIYDLSHGRVRTMRTGEFIPFFTDIFINGFGHLVNGKDNILTPNPDAFLNEYFELYRPIESLDFEEAVSIFTEDYAIDELDFNTKNRKAFNGLNKIYDFFVKKADETIDVIFSPYGPYTMYEEFLENPNYWAYRCKKQVRDFIRIFLESPLAGNTDNARDIPAMLRSIFRSGTNGYLLLDPGIKTGAIYSGNPLFDNGLKIPITFDELIELLSPEDRRDFSADALYVIQTAYSYLDFFKYWEMKGDGIANKMKEAYNKYIAIFTRENLGQYFDRTFTIHFLVDGGMGVTSYNTIAKRFSDIESYIVEFRPSDPTQLRNAIATLLTYKLLFPDTFANIKLKQSKLQFIYSDLFTVHMPEYVQPKLGGTFMWDGREGLTREKYEDFANGLNNIFDHTDQHFFLAFGTSFDRILKTFTDLFQREIDESIAITDLRI